MFVSMETPQQDSVEQMEAELSQQLSALRTEIEQNGFQHGAGARSYSSVLPPKDVSFFRMEREHAIKRGLQVAQALPVQSQADVMQAELQSCFSLEYTSESLPLLLHQFYTDRSSHLAQIKYLLMLRWRRFCRHTSIIEKIYPHYKDQVLFLASEYEDAVQRARRLSVSREKILTGQGNLADLLTQDDVVIYLRWLICHLHSVKHIYNFLMVLHYLPAAERKDKGFQQKEETSCQIQRANGISGQIQMVPLRSVRLAEFLPELQALISYFHVSFNTEKLRTTADEMELFKTVWKEFKTMFRQQEQMKTFPQCNSTEVKESQWGRKSGSSALRKEADWIPFIQVKPRRDPWQEKLIMKLKEQRSVDELLKMYCRFLQIQDLLQVTTALKDHATHMTNLGSVSHSSKTKRQKVFEIWTSVYNAACLTQEPNSHLSKSRGRGGNDINRPKKPMSANERLQSLDDGTSDLITNRGAYLSLIYLRHLKLRELQRVSLGMLNYLRSVERSLTFDLAGLQLEEGEMSCMAEETGWMNAARGGRGEAGSLGSPQFIHNSPVDYKVHCSEFMEFAEVENLHDFYSTEGCFIHTQDQQGFYIIYDVALKDLDELEAELLLVGSHFIQRNEVERLKKAELATSSSTINIDRVSVLLDLWTCHTEFLENKVQLLNCYYEAYQHTAGTEERFALAQVITDIMHSRPQLDLNQNYFVQAYRAEIDCLRSHQQLIKYVLDNQIEKQRQYLQRIWRQDHKASTCDFGLPLNYIPKHVVSLGGSSPGLMNMFLLEVHPSLCQASVVYNSLVQTHTELCQLHQATSVSDRLVLQQTLLHQALYSWNNLPAPEAAYSSKIQKDLFSDVFFEDPLSVQKLGLLFINSAEEQDMKLGREKQSYVVETFSMLLELVTIRHRLMVSASETAHLAQLYRKVASELSFSDFHLYLRPVEFEETEQKIQAEQRPVFITMLLEDDSSVDRFTPSHLPLSIQELDEKEIGRFSFSSQEAVIHLMNKQSVENLQVTLASQVSQKNALISSVKVACLCYWAESREIALCPHQDLKSATSFNPKQEKSNSSPSKGSMKTRKERLMKAFVSIQLEKVGLRDEMLNAFVKKKQAVGGLIMKTPEETAKIKRSLIIDFLQKFNTQISQYCVRAQIVAYYYSLTALLDNIPSIRQSHFMTEQSREHKGGEVYHNPRRFQHQRQRHCLLSTDGKTVLNLWTIPHYSEVLHMFKTLEVSACATALHHTLQIVSALHDIIYYLMSFSRLGNAENSCSQRRSQEVTGSRLVADWGGAEGIGVELQEIQRQVDRLCDPSSPESVGQLLQLRRQVILLQFETAVRIFIREVFLSSGDIDAYQSVSDNMATVLPLLSDSVKMDMISVMLPVPQPLESRDCQAQKLFSWRSFLTRHGLLPFHVWDIPPIEYCMQLCLSGLSDRCRLKANAAILSVSLLMEDVLNAGGNAEPVHLQNTMDDLLHNEEPNEGEISCLEAEKEEKMTCASSSALHSHLPLQDPVQVQSVLRGFLLLTKQLHVFKENWARRRLGTEIFSLPSLYQQFVKLYGAEIFYPSMKALAQHLGKECEYELLISGSQSLLPPPGASEVNVKHWQLHKLLEITECDMIKVVQRRINTELNLVASERTQQDSHFPTELWRKVQQSLSPERPQIMETFVQQLMDGAEQMEGQLRISQDHLQLCFTHLGSSLMERERRCFLIYSQFYERILQQKTQLLYQKEQDLKNLKRSQMSSSHTKVSALCHGMMLEISALQARVAHLKEEKHSLEKQLSLKFKERYDPLVRQLLSFCIQLQAKVDECRLQVEQDVSVMVNTVRDEGVDRILKLKKKYGCSKDDDGLILTQSKREEVHELNMENRRLAALLCKLQALSRWRRVVEKEKLHQQLLQMQQSEITSRTDALRVKMAAEEEVVFLQEELNAARQALTCCQAQCSRTEKLLSRKTEELQMAQHQSVQEARSHQELDSYRVQSLEQIKADVEDRDRQLRELSEQMDRDSRMNRLERQRSAKEIRQVKNQLHQERSLKQDAFQQVDKLQNQVNEMEAAFSRCKSATGQSRRCYTLSISRMSNRSPSAGFRRVGQRSSTPQLGSFTNHTALKDSAVEPQRQRAETARTFPDGPPADLSGLRILTAQTLLPKL